MQGAIVFAFILLFPAAVQAQQQPVRDEAESQDGATGRGVRIIAPETPPVATVANPSQPIADPNHAVAPYVATPVNGQPAPSVSPGVSQAPQPSVLKACDRPVAKPVLRFADPARFDRALRSKLRRGRTVSVDIENPYPADNEAPAPLGAWLNEIGKSGGTVSASPYCQKARGMGGFLAKLFGGGPAEPYRAARRYDAIVHVDAVDRVVTQVEFTPRKGMR